MRLLTRYLTKFRHGRDTQLHEPPWLPTRANALAVPWGTLHLPATLHIHAYQLAAACQSYSTCRHTKWCYIHACKPAAQKNAIQRGGRKHTVARTPNLSRPNKYAKDTVVDCAELVVMTAAPPKRPSALCRLQARKLSLKYQPNPTNTTTGAAAGVGVESLQQLLGIGAGAAAGLGATAGGGVGCSAVLLVAV